MKKMELEEVILSYLLTTYSLYYLFKYYKCIYMILLDYKNDSNNYQQQHLKLYRFS